ncbi:DUF1120 domain-containing protein [Pseudomonas sp. ChxA]|uniref:DUF1120 domain-containing protein n=1 Tax=Pseudomonas sp. ChxA TaxID=3035473 RepID=UPI00255731F2|nr:DUF1120 domain-containing protein [Pseudomonas sp. ChxA]MDL2187901.1 DUF1120 domain-containing protein [Pseudomonas sp. ChxA]
MAARLCASDYLLDERPKVSIDMQPSRALVTAAFLLAGVSNVMAASSVDLAVTGIITPSACTPTLSNNGVVDYGKISIQEFPDQGYMVLPQAIVQLEVNCNAPMLMAVKITDNRVGTAIPQYSGDPGFSRFGLGMASGDVKIGWYQLKMANATADGVPGSSIEAVRPAGPWLDAYNAVWQQGWLRTIKDASSADVTPLPMTTFAVQVLIDTSLGLKKDLPVTEEILIDGSATMEVIYI